MSNGRAVRTNMANCVAAGLGAGREEEFCVNVPGVDECELCITSCAGMFDGRYQSCTSCKDYIVCEDNKIKEVKTCKTGIFSAFDGQCSLNSKSCGVKENINSCKGLADGRYPSSKGPEYFNLCRNQKIMKDRRCGPADKFRYKYPSKPITRPVTRAMEYNHFLRACENYRSPTCQRTLDSNFGFVPPPTVDLLYLSDEPSIKYEDVLVDDLPVEDDKTEELHKFKDWINETTRKDKMPPRRMNKVCITTCSDVDDGLYGSCRGCDIFAQCTDGYLREERCQDKMEFDTEEKKCVKKSDTCTLRDDSGWLS